jgi:hypothetical protein
MLKKKKVAGAFCLYTRTYAKCTFVPLRRTITEPLNAAGLLPPPPIAQGCPPPPPLRLTTKVYNPPLPHTQRLERSPPFFFRRLTNLF